MLLLLVLCVVAVADPLPATAAVLGGQRFVIAVVAVAAMYLAEACSLVSAPDPVAVAVVTVGVAYPAWPIVVFWIDSPVHPAGALQTSGAPLC